MKARESETDMIEFDIIYDTDNDRDTWAKKLNALKVELSMV